MKKLFDALGYLKISLAVALMAFSAGCVGYGGGGYDYVGGPYVGPVVDADFYGGFYGRGHDVHAFSHRGFASRGVAHGGGFGHGGGHR
jgi:hypothetical protein